MADNPQQRGSPDRDRISLEQEHEVRYWTKTLNVSVERLRDAVKAVGHSADRVRDFLSKDGAPRAQR